VVNPRALTYRVACQEWLSQGVRASRYLPTTCEYIWSAEHVSRQFSNGMSGQFAFKVLPPTKLHPGGHSTEMMLGEVHSRSKLDDDARVELVCHCDAIMRRFAPKTEPGFGPNRRAQHIHRDRERALVAQSVHEIFPQRMG